MRQVLSSFILTGLLVLGSAVSTANAHSNAQLNVQSSAQTPAENPSSVIEQTSALSNELGSPQDLLTQAEKGPFDFLDVVGKIDSYRPEFRKREQVEPYILILPELEQIGINLDATEIQMQTFKNMAFRLTRHSLRWINVFRDSTEVVVQYHRYADEAAAFELIQQAQWSMQTIVEEESRRRGAETIAALSDWALEANLSRSLLNSYRETRSEIAVQSLTPIGSLAIEDVAFWISHLSPQQGYERYLLSVQEYVLTLTPEDAEAYQLLTRVIAQIGGLINDNLKDTPQYTQTLNSDIAREVFSRMIEAEVPFVEEVFEDFISAMNRASLQSLALSLIGRSYTPSKEYSSEYLKRMDSLLNLPQWDQMTKERQQLQRYFEQMASSLFARIHEIEGTWKLKGDNGKNFNLTIIFSRDNELKFGLAEDGKKTAAFFAFHYVGYDAATKMFVASENGPDATARSNAIIRFKLEGGQLKGFFDTNLNPNIHFSGTKKEVYRDFLGSGESVLTDGVYQGHMACKGFKSDVQLTVVTINGFQMGRLHFKSLSRVHQTFETGLYGTTGNAVYLTAAARSFIHFRAELINNELVNGQYILGGLGIRCDNVKLKRVSDVSPQQLGH